MESKGLKDVLIDVRSSFRLIYKYQRRVLDLVNYCGLYYKFKGYRGGWPMYSHPSPQRGRGKLYNWSWDWLNMYLYDFHFEDRQVNNENVKFSIVLQSDTGYYDSKFNDGSKLDKVSIDLFSEVSESETRLIFIISKEGWDIDKLFLKGSTSLKELKLSKKEEEWILKESGYYIVAKAYNLTKFINQKETDKVLEAFIQFCKENGITIKDKNEV